MQRLLTRPRFVGLMMAVPIVPLARVCAEGERADPKALTFTLPADIKWSGGTTSQQAVLVGDPSKEGFYVVLTKWLPHNNSRPHFHPNDRFITVISGTWWVGTGAS